MRTMLKSLFLFLAIFTLMISCTKTGHEKTNFPSSQAALASFDAKRPAIAEALMGYLIQNGTANVRQGTARFIVPFFTVDSWGVMELDPVTNTYASVIFAATVLDKNDYYRLNNDGTVSVHISRKNALAQYYADSFSASGLYLSSTEANYTANYTGPVVELIFPDFVVKFIDLDNGVPRAMSLHGNAKLLNMGQGPLYTLIARVVQTPSGQTQREFLLR